jgi:alpha-L-fucosidase
MLVDIVSRNGNLLLNFPLPGSGQLDDRELAVLSAITDWMAVNKEGIYASRPWKIYGDGPSTLPSMERPGRLGFNERGRKDLTPEDIRFTTKGGVIYAFVMGIPQQQAIIKPLASNSPQQPGKIQHVELLGHKGKLKWTQDETALKVDLPDQKPCDFALTFKVATA